MMLLKVGHYRENRVTIFAAGFGFAGSRIFSPRWKSGLPNSDGETFHRSMQRFLVQHTLKEQSGSFKRFERSINDVRLKSTMGYLAERKFNIVN